MSKRYSVLNDFWYLNNDNVLFAQGKAFQLNDVAFLLIKTVMEIGQSSDSMKVLTHDVNWMSKIEQLVSLNLDKIIYEISKKYDIDDKNRVYKDCINVFLSVKNQGKTLIYDKAKAPIQVDVALTYRCNNHCLFCYHGGSRDVGELSIMEWDLVLNKLRDFGVFVINLTGGEPTLRLDVVEHCLVKYRDDFRFQMTTNGRLLSLDVCNSLRDKGLDFVQISIEHSVAARHNDMCGSSEAWMDTVRGIRNALKSGLSVGTLTTLTRDNRDSIEDLIMFLMDIGVTNIATNSLFYDQRARVVNRLSNDELRDVLERILVIIGNRAKLSFLFPVCCRQLDLAELGLEIKRCTAAVSTLHIESDGNVIPCQSWFHESCGNIITDDFDKIWRSDVAVSVRKRKKQEQCVRCEWIDQCNGDCPLKF